MIPGCLMYRILSLYDPKTLSEALQNWPDESRIYMDTNILIPLVCHSDKNYENVNEWLTVLSEIGFNFRYTNRTNEELESHLENIAREQIIQLEQLPPEILSRVLQEGEGLSPITVSYFKEGKYINWKHFRRRWDEEFRRKIRKFNLKKEKEIREKEFVKEKENDIVNLARDFQFVVGFDIFRADHDAFLIKYVSEKRKREEEKVIPKNWIWTFDRRYILIFESLAEARRTTLFGEELGLIVSLIQPRILEKIEINNVLKASDLTPEKIKLEDLLKKFQKIKKDIYTDDLVANISKIYKILSDEFFKEIFSERSRKRENDITELKKYRKKVSEKLTRDIYSDVTKDRLRRILNVIDKELEKLEKGEGYV